LGGLLSDLGMKGAAIHFIMDLVAFGLGLQLKKSSLVRVSEPKLKKQRTYTGQSNNIPSSRKVRTSSDERFQGTKKKYHSFLEPKLKRHKWVLILSSILSNFALGYCNLQLVAPFIFCP
jgi:hypothetical protein